MPFWLVLLTEHEVLHCCAPNAVCHWPWQVYPSCSFSSADYVPHCRILSPDKTEWWLILATLCRWNSCFMADQLWLMTHIREEEEADYASKFPTLVRKFTEQNWGTKDFWQVKSFNQNHIFVQNFQGSLKHESWKFNSSKCHNSYSSILAVWIYSVSQKNETLVILNILYSCKYITMTFSTWYPDGLNY